MTNGFTLPVDYFVRFMLIFFRLGGIIVFAPFFNHRSFPTLVRISLTLFLSLIVFPIVTDQNFVSPTSIYSFFLAIFFDFGVSHFSIYLKGIMGVKNHHRYFGRNKLKAEQAFEVGDYSVVFSFYRCLGWNLISKFL